MRKAAWILAFVGLALPASAEAQEIIGLVERPRGCDQRLDHRCVPARLEWAPWVGGGIAFGVGERALPALGVGLELTTGVLDWAGVPLSGEASDTKGDARGYRAELRVGPWVYAETRGTGQAVAEAGLTMHFGSTNDQLPKLARAVPGGMFDLRAGGGYGAFPAGRAPHFALALGWGYRVAPDRSSWGGACRPDPPAATLADATVFRLVTTARHSPELEAWEIGLALEVSPTIVMLVSRSEAPR